MRKHLSRDFNRIYILDLKGNIRKDSMKDGIPLGEKYTIFGLAAMVGVAITFLIRNKRNDDFKIFYSSVDFRATRIEKFSLMEQAKTIQNLAWRNIIPNEKGFWLNDNIDTSFDNFIPIGEKEGKSTTNDCKIFRNYGRGVATCRDSWAYNFSKHSLSENINKTIQTYNEFIYRWINSYDKSNIDDFVIYDETKISWSRDLKLDLQRGKLAEFKCSKIRKSLYRPFTKKYLFFDQDIK